MKIAVALIALIVVAGIAECKPSLKSLRARLLAKGQKRTVGGNDESVANTEFAALVGKCESFEIMSDIVEAVIEDDADMADFFEGHESILEDACPITMGVAEHLIGADPVQQDKASSIIQRAFRLLQCVNLQATKEGLLFLMAVVEQDPDDSVYLQESEEVFDDCNALFEDVSREDHELVKALNDLDETLLGDDKRDAGALLRQLKKFARKV